MQCDINDKTTRGVNELTGDDGPADSADVNVIPLNAVATENATDSEPTKTTPNVGTANGTGVEDDAYMGAYEIEIRHFELPSLMIIGFNSPRKRPESAKCWTVVKRLRSAQDAPEHARKWMEEEYTHVYVHLAIVLPDEWVDSFAIQL